MTRPATVRPHRRTPASGPPSQGRLCAVDAPTVTVVPFDDQVVQGLLAEWSEELGGSVPGFSPSDRCLIDAAELAPPHGVFLVVSDAGNPVGCGGLRRLSATVGEVKRLFVRPGARGRGVGRLLLDALERRAAGLSLERLRLDTDGGHPASLALFRALGYQPIPDYNGNPHVCYWFEKTLGTQPGRPSPYAPLRSEFPDRRQRPDAVREALVHSPSSSAAAEHATAAISVMLIVPEAGEATAWYKEALGAEERWNLGSVVGLEIGGAPFFLHEANPGHPTETSPAAAGATSVRIELFVADPDAVVGRALAAGAAPGSPVETRRRPWGPHRQGGFTDPFGHTWSVGDTAPLARASGSSSA